MKKVFLLCALFAGALTVNAQTQQGNMMAGGTLRFQSTSYQNGNANETATFTFSPNFGYFVGEDFAVGLNLAFTTQRNGTGDNKSTSNAFGIGPFARYYLFTSNSQFGFFGQAALGFSTGKNESAAGAVTKTSNVSFSVSPGAAFFFNEHWAMELMITALSVSSYDPNKNNDNDKSTTFNFGVNTLSPTVGVRYHF